MNALIQRLPSRGVLIVALIAGLGLIACATPPKELLEARQTYADVAEGPTSEYAPAELQSAKDALDQAEAAFKKDGDSEVTRALAYRATRTAQIAEVEGDTYRARREQEEAQEQLLEESEKARKQLQGTLADRERDLASRREQLNAARADLESAQESLDQAKKEGTMTEKELEAKREELRKKQASLAEKEQQLAVTKTELQSERERRKEVEQRLAEARKKLEEFAKVEENDDRIVITLTGEVLFELDKSALRTPAKARLDQVAEVLLADRDRAVTVQGHTDSQGKESYNQKLSQDRAESVRTYLISQGIASDRIRAVGKGESEPVSSNDTPEGRAMNRRVEIIIDKASK